MATAEYNRAYYAKNKDKLNAQNKQWRDKNAERLREYSREYYYRNRDERRAYKRKWHQQNKDYALQKMREYHKRNPRTWRGRLARYGLTKEKFDGMLAAQHNSCAACATTNPTTKWGWHVDHCHRTGITRGILCHHCNVAIGCARDDPGKLRQMAAYLEGWQSWQNLS